jgi:molybdate transport system ATP-binding protein
VYTPHRRAADVYDLTAAPLVALDHVTAARGGSVVLADITWRLRAGEHWGIVGENGSGKSSFLALVAGTLWPAPGGGSRVYDFGGGPQTDAVDARQRIVIVGHELQDRYAKWNWNFAAVDVVLSGVYRTDVPRRRPEAPERSRALAVMRELGVVHLAERPFLQLSRGEQRRVLIARGVAFAPAVLLLDEPASGLDARARAELDELVRRASRDVTIVCAAHVEEDLPAVVDHVLKLAAGRVVASGERNRDARRRFAGSATAAAGSARARPAPAAHAEPLIVVEHANVWLGTRHVIADLDWRLDAGQQWLVTGGNGAGKSTFLRLLHGQLRPALGGAVRWPGLGDPRNVWTLRRSIAWVSPELQAAYRYPTTVRECVASGFESSIGLARAPSGEQLRRVDRLLDEFELAALADRPLATLSYGQARRALIARALVHRPRVLLLDEPWEGLDAAVAGLLSRTLAAVVAEGTQIVCASHLAAHREIFTHELVLEHGKAVRSGPLHSHE